MSFFHVKPVKLDRLVISTHNDDEGLFSSYTIQREKAQVIIVFDSFVQLARGFYKCDARTRRAETEAALKEMGVPPAIFLGFSDEEKCTPDLEHRVAAALMEFSKGDAIVWSPAEEVNGHDQHNLVARACNSAFGSRIQDRYLSYTRTGGKSTSKKEVEVQPDWIIPKLRALACYRTQIEEPKIGCWPHFIRSQSEYYQ